MIFISQFTIHLPLFLHRNFKRFANHLIQVRREGSLTADRAVSPASSSAAEAAWQKLSGSRRNWRQQFPFISTTRLHSPSLCPPSPQRSSASTARRRHSDLCRVANKSKEDHCLDGKARYLCQGSEGDGRREI